MAETTPLLDNDSSQKQRMLGALLAALRSHEMSSDQLLPALVVSYDRDKNIAVVQPLIKLVDVNNGQISRHQLAGINVLSLGGGGFHINFPLAQGDLGWILASDRDISLFKQSLAETVPNTGRLHTFEDGWFVPDVFRKYTINTEDSASMVIQSTDAATRIAIKNGQVKITAPTKVIVDTPLAEFTNDVVIDGTLGVTGAASMASTLSVAGQANLNGGLHVAGGHTVDLPSETTVGGTTVATHGHISSSPGTRTSGGMIA